jgi:hypothetical protein
MGSVEEPTAEVRGEWNEPDTERLIALGLLRPCIVSQANVVKATKRSGRTTYRLRRRDVTVILSFRLRIYGKPSLLSAKALIEGGLDALPKPRQEFSAVVIEFLDMDDACQKAH